MFGRLHAHGTLSPTTGAWLRLVLRSHAGSQVDGRRIPHRQGEHLAVRRDAQPAIATDPGCHQLNVRSPALRFGNDEPQDDLADVTALRRQGLRYLALNTDGRTVRVHNSLNNRQSHTHSHDRIPSIALSHPPRS